MTKCRETELHEKSVKHQANRGMGSGRRFRDAFIEFQKNTDERLQDLNLYYDKSSPEMQELTLPLLNRFRELSYASLEFFRSRLNS